MPAWRIIVSIAACTLVALQPAASPAQSGPESLLQYEESVSVGFVLVPVTVRSKSDFVTDLEREDFEILVEGESVEFDSFDRGATLPLDIVVLQDLSGSMAIGGKLAISRELVNCLIATSTKGDRFALASFADRRTVVDVPYTGDVDALTEATAAWQAYGLTALHDAVAQLPEIDPEGGHPHKAVLLLTDGAENASQLEPEVARSVVRQADLPVFVLDIGGTAARPPQPGEQETENRILLRRLAAATGGKYIYLDSLDGAVDTCYEIATTLRSQYLLGFATDWQGDIRYRELKVVIPKKNLKYSARAGYVGLPPTPASRAKMED